MRNMRVGDMQFALELRGTPGEVVSALGVIELGNPVFALCHLPDGTTQACWLEPGDLRRGIRVFQVRDEHDNLLNRYLVYIRMNTP